MKVSTLKANRMKTIAITQAELEVLETALHEKRREISTLEEGRLQDAVDGNASDGSNDVLGTLDGDGLVHWDVDIQFVSLSFCFYNLNDARFISRVTWPTSFSRRERTPQANHHILLSRSQLN